MVLATVASLLYATVTTVTNITVLFTLLYPFGAFFGDEHF